MPRSSKLFLSFRFPLSKPRVFLALIKLIVLGEETKSWISSSCRFLQSSVTFSLFGPNIFLSTAFQNNQDLCPSPDHVPRPCKNRENYRSVHLMNGHAGALQTGTTRAYVLTQTVFHAHVKTGKIVVLYI